MHTGKTTPKPLIILVLTASTILMACLIAGGYHWWQWKQQYEAVKRLTDTYGTETKAAIQNFELRWFSLDAHRNPSIQSELATELYLDRWGFAGERQNPSNGGEWSITKSVNVTRVRVLEYSSERFKAVAQSVRMIDEITQAGEEYVKSFPYDRCGVYVFFREDGTWKVAAYFNADPRYAEQDWNYNPSDWEHQIIGDIPDDILYDCEGFLSQ